jgi:limonene-1,2-epoxide hydrolase
MGANATRMAYPSHSPPSSGSEGWARRKETHLRAEIRLSLARQTWGASMSDREEGIVREFLGLIVTGDIARAADHFADDGSYRTYAWQEPTVGVAAIRAVWERQAAAWSDFHYDLVNIASAGAVVFTERVSRWATRWRFTRSGCSRLTAVGRSRAGVNTPTRGRLSSSAPDEKSPPISPGRALYIPGTSPSWRRMVS